MLRFFIGLGHHFAIKHSHPIGQHTQRVTTVFEEAANGRQTVIGLHTALLQYIGHPHSQLFIVAGFQMLGIYPPQFGVVKLSRTAAQVVEIKPI